ncbi:unnamed protein product, partial [Amoebophrya sp. A120]
PAEATHKTASHASGSAGRTGAASFSLWASPLRNASACLAWPARATKKPKGGERPRGRANRLDRAHAGAPRRHDRGCRTR